MKIQAIEPFEECIGDEYMKLIEFDTDISRAFIFYMSQFGEMEYHDSFTRPLFTLRIDNCFTFKGIQGFPTARLILNPDAIEENLKKFHDMCEQFEPEREYQLCQ
ncbi:MAG: hypothetical protein R3F48_05970 [Candidatus Zixiibacteriota bacterium]